MATVVFEAGTIGHTYRIPALAVTPAGTLLAFCERRNYDRHDHGDIDVVLKRSKDLGKTWSEEEVVYAGAPGVWAGNPCVIMDGDTVRLVACRCSRRMFVFASTDEGETWSRRGITDSVWRPEWDRTASGPGTGIMLAYGTHVGRLVIPCWYVDNSSKDLALSSHSYVIYSDDCGRTWARGDPAGPGTNECAVMQLKNGDLILNMKSCLGKKRRALSRSTDGGATWGNVIHKKALPEPRGTQASLVIVPPDDLGRRLRVAFCNAAGPERTQLTLRISENNGKDWSRSKVLRPGFSAYSSLAILRNGQIGVLYERSRKNEPDERMTRYEQIAFQRVWPADVPPNEPGGA